MSIAERWRRKQQKKLEKKVNSLNFNCPYCNFPIPEEAFNTPDYGMSYKCKVCGKVCYEGYKEQILSKK